MLSLILPSPHTIATAAVPLIVHTTLLCDFLGGNVLMQSIQGGKL